MPVYEFTCKDHGVFEEMRSVKAFSRSAQCPECGSASPLKFSKPGRHIMDFISGWNGGAGTYFDTKKDRETWMRSKGMARA